MNISIREDRAGRDRPERGRRPRPWRPVVCVAGVVALLLGSGAIPASATFHGDNGRIVFRRYLNQEKTSGAIFTVKPNGQGERQITHPPDGFIDDDPDYSPDGRRIAFMRLNFNACGPDCLYASLFVVNADGSGLRQLTSTTTGVDCANGGGCTTEPAWSPDGRWIAFSRQSGPLLADDEWTEQGIYMIRADGSHLTQVTQRQRPSTGADDSPQFSPDGRTIVFERRNIRGLLPDQGQAVWTVGVDGRHERRLTPYDLLGGDTEDWSPDGKLILFESNENGPADVSANIYTIRPNGTGLKQLTFAEGGETRHWASSFSPDGKKITFARSPGTGPDGNADVYTMRADGSHVRQVTTNTLWDSRPDWGPAL
jgi:TolB protein